MLLSICIPSYSRFEHLKKLLSSILTADSTDFEVIIVDNGSPGDITEEVSFYDKRLRIVKRDLLVKGPTNVRLALDYANGKYAMVCLDKDYIIGEKLDVFIEKLGKLHDVSCGYCELNSSSKSNYFIVSDNIMRNIYRCGHPSGSFFKNDAIKEESNELDLMNEKSLFYNNPFLIDLLYAKCLCNGKQAVYPGIMVNTETLEQATKVKSHSYSKADNNVYFMPFNRTKQFWVFIEHLRRLDLARGCYAKIVNRLISKTMKEVSIGYKHIMSNEAICSHYGIETVNVNKGEVIEELNRFAQEIRYKGISFVSKNKIRYVVFKNGLKAKIRILLNA